MKPTATRMGAAVLMAASVTTPAMAESLDEWLAGDYATGDWGGARQQLIDAGITFYGVYATDLQALVSGGEADGGNWDYAGRMLIGFDFDLDKLAGLPGLSLYAEGAWSSGEDLARKVGSVFPPAQTFTGRSVRLSKLYLQQILFDETLTLKIGRLATEDDFLSSPLYWNYVSGAINGVPFGIPDSTPGFSTSPFTQWGATGVYQPIEQIRLALGVFSSDDAVNKDKEHGVDFSLNADNGIMSIGEVGYLWNQAEGDEGLPGNFKVGVYYDTGPREDLRNEERNNGDNAGFYVAVDQMVYREEDTKDQGLTPWAVINYSPRNSINQIPFYLGAGMVYKGPFATRDDDKAAVGFYYGLLSDDIPDVSSEKVLELAYTAQFTPWLYVMPSAQFIFQPGGNSDTSNAFVFGGEIGITF